MKLVWITINRATAARPVMTCRRCNATVDVPFDTPLGVPSEVVRAFMNLHRHCEAAFVAPRPEPKRREKILVN